MPIHWPTWSDRGAVCGRCSPSLRSRTRAAPFIPHEAENREEVHRDGRLGVRMSFLSAVVNALTNKWRPNRCPEGCLSRAPERRPASVNCIYCFYDQDQVGYGTSPLCRML